MKKPPDILSQESIKTDKNSLQAILLPGVDYLPLYDAINRTHQLTILLYQFVRAFILFKYEKGESVPHIDIEFIRMAFRALSLQPKAGRKPIGTNAQLLTEFLVFYDTEFVPLVNGNQKFDASCLSHILEYSRKNIVTAIENNIKRHFIRHLKHYVNISFQDKITEAQSLPRKERDTTVRAIYKELNSVKDDLINNTLMSDITYHTWITDFREKMLPKESVFPLNMDTVDYPQRYLKSMYLINKSLEEKGLKQFQFMPLRTEIVPKYIVIDTSSLVALFIKDNQKQYTGDIEGAKVPIWNQFFNMKAKAFKRKGHEFNWMISTDGYAVSISFIEATRALVEQKRHKASMKALNKQSRILYKGKTQEENDKIKTDKQRVIKEKTVENRKVNREKAISAKKDKPLNPIEGNYLEEFPYFDKLNVEDTNQLKALSDANSRNLVYVDPGKRSILYMMNDEDPNDPDPTKRRKFLNYTNRTRVTETKRLKYQRLRENYKTRTDTIGLETELAKYNQKTCVYSKFKEYIKHKNLINSQLFKHYEEPLFRKLNWFSHINRQRSEVNLLNSIAKRFGEDAVLIIGDWSHSGKIHYMSTPGVSLKRKIAKRFQIYSIDEFRTSCINNKTEERCGNMYLRDKMGVLRKKHAILSYTNENREGYVNRDRNSVLSMRKIVKTQLKTGVRPVAYQRGHELADNLKTSENYQGNSNKKTEPDIMNNQTVKLKPLIKKKVGSPNEIKALNLQEAHLECQMSASYLFDRSAILLFPV